MSFLRDAMFFDGLMNGRSCNFHLENAIAMVITEQNRINSLGAEKFNICAGAGEEKATLGAGRSQGVRIGHFCSRPYEIPKRNLCQFDLHPVWEIVWSTLVSFKSES